MPESLPGSTTALREELAAANARADAATVLLRRYQTGELVPLRTQEALAAARREREELRAKLDLAQDDLDAIDDEARLSIDGGGDRPAKAIRTIWEITRSFRAALSVPAAAAGEDSK